MPKRDLINEFKEYYDSKSEDAQELIRRFILTESPKSQSPAPRAVRSSSSKKKGLPSAASSSVEAEKEPVAIGASGAGGD